MHRREVRNEKTGRDMRSGHCHMQPYITLLGTKAYAWGCNSHFEDSEEAEKEGGHVETQQRCSPLLRPRRSVSLRRRRWRHSCLLQSDENMGGGAALERGGDDADADAEPSRRLMRGNIYCGLAGDWSHLHPTTVVVPPVALPNTASALPPLSLSPLVVPEVPQAKFAATPNPSSPPSVPLVRWGDGGAFKTCASLPRETPVASARQTEKEAGAADVVLLQTAAAAAAATSSSTAEAVATISTAAPTATTAPPIPRENTVEKIFSCSSGNHQCMLEGGLVYCPGCGDKLRHDAPVEYAVSDCPMTHEREYGNMAVQNEEDRYCVLCGALIIYRLPSCEAGKESVIGDVSLHQHQLYPFGGAAAAAAAVAAAEPLKPKSSTVPLSIAARAAVPPSVTLEGLQGVAACTAPMYDTVTEAVTAKVDEDNTDPVLRGLGMARQLDDVLHGGPITKVSSASGNKYERCEDVRPNTPVTARRVTAPFPAAAAAAAATTTTSTETQTEIHPKAYTSVGCSPCDLVSNPKSEESSSVKEQLKAAATTNAGHTTVPPSTTLQQMQYTCGVPGVSCGLPGCALCPHSLRPSLPLVKPTSPLHSSRSEASVVVVHNHYYHRM